jgi:tetratricopeptide (TPR) repeat protein
MQYNKYFDLIHNYINANGVSEEIEALDKILASNAELYEELKAIKNCVLAGDNSDIEERITLLADDIEMYELVNEVRVEIKAGVNVREKIDALYQNSKAELAEEQAITAGVLAYNEAEEQKKEQVPAATSSVQVVEIPKPQVKIIPMRVFRLAAAAMLLVGLGVWLLGKEQDFNPKPYLAEDTQTVNQTIKGMTTGDVYKEIYSLYSSGNYLEVIAAVDTLREGYNKSNRLKVLQAGAHIQLQQYENAIIILKPIIESDVLPDDKEKAQYFLALAYISTKKSEEGRSVLKAMIEKNDKENKYLDKAKILFDNTK